MAEIFIFIAVGLLGGITRTIYGLLKALNNGIEINTWYFIITLIISALIGGLLGLIFDVDYRIAALAGYVGTDVLENIFKSSIGNIVIKGR